MSLIYVADHGIGVCLLNLGLRHNLINMPFTKLALNCFSLKGNAMVPQCIYTVNNKHTIYILSILMKCGTRLGELAPNDPPITDGCSFTSRLHLCFLTYFYLMSRYTIRDVPLYKFCSFFLTLFKKPLIIPPLPSPPPLPKASAVFLTWV